MRKVISRLFLNFMLVTHYTGWPGERNAKPRITPAPSSRFYICQLWWLSFELTNWKNENFVPFGFNHRNTALNVWFREWQMKMLLLDLFFAGMETTVTTMKWGFLMIIIHPHVQKRIQTELDHCGGTIQLSDRNNCPYTMATLNVKCYFALFCRFWCEWNKEWQI